MDAQYISEYCQNNVKLCGVYSLENVYILCIENIYNATENVLSVLIYIVYLY